MGGYSTEASTTLSQFATESSKFASERRCNLRAGCPGQRTRLNDAEISY
jgi:hypothetical protein